jgi:hypothetical protein
MYVPFLLPMPPGEGTVSPVSQLGLVNQWLPRELSRLYAGQTLLVSQNLKPPWRGLNSLHPISKAFMDVAAFHGQMQLLRLQSPRTPPPCCPLSSAQVGSPADSDPRHRHS